MSNTKALPGIYSCEPVHGSLCATISTQLTRIHRKNTIVSIKSKFFVVFKINFFMITSFSFLETMLKCVCVFGHGFHVLVPFRSGNFGMGFFLYQNSFSLSSFRTAFSSNSCFLCSANLFRTFTGGKSISIDISLINAII